MSLTTDAQYSRLNSQEPAEDVETGSVNAEQTAPRSWCGRKVAILSAYGISQAFVVFFSFCIGLDLDPKDKYDLAVGYCSASVLAVVGIAFPLALLNLANHR